ncbi:phosphotyrosine protein phosphatase [Nanoarchaeota archaeon]
MKVLFVCNQNQHRSKRAAEIFRDRFDTASAGLYNGKPVTSQNLEWADLVIVMEDEQRIEIGKRYPREYLGKRIISLGVPDVFDYGTQQLDEELQRKFLHLAEPLIESG